MWVRLGLIAFVGWKLLYLFAPNLDGNISLSNFVYHVQELYLITQKVHYFPSLSGNEHFRSVLIIQNMGPTCIRPYCRKSAKELGWLSWSATSDLSYRRRTIRHVDQPLSLSGWRKINCSTCDMLSFAQNVLAVVQVWFPRRHNNWTIRFVTAHLASVGGR